MTFGELFEIIREHVEANLSIYIVLCVILVPFLYATRRWSFPLIFYTVETCIYLGIMHTIIHGIVKVALWFYINTRMKALSDDTTPPGAPDWGTPWVDFWNYEAYSPTWVAYMELVFALIIIFLVWRYRPPRFKIKPARVKQQSKEQESARKEFEEKRKRYLDDILP